MRLLFYVQTYWTEFSLDCDRCAISSFNFSVNCPRLSIVFLEFSYMSLQKMWSEADSGKPCCGVNFSDEVKFILICKLLSFKYSCTMFYRFIDVLRFLNFYSNPLNHTLSNVSVISIKTAAVFFLFMLFWKIELISRN